MTRAGDRLTASILPQRTPENSPFYSVEYERPILTPGLSVSANYSCNLFDVGDALRDLELSGISQVASVKTRYALVRSPLKNLYAEAGISRIQSIPKRAKVPLAKDDLSTAEVEVSFDTCRCADTFNHGRLRWCDHGVAEPARRYG